MIAEIKCAHAEVWPLANFVPHPRNPNKHPAEQLRLLGKVITAQGWRSPVVVSKRSGLVIKGHGRLQAAALAGMESAPVDLQDYASETEELADLVADNRLSELAEMSESELRDLLGSIDPGTIDMEIAGFSADALEDLLRETAAPDAFPVVDENLPIAHKCPRCGYAWSGKPA